MGGEVADADGVGRRGVVGRGAFAAEFAGELGGAEAEVGELLRGAELGGFVGGVGELEGGLVGDGVEVAEAADVAEDGAAFVVGGLGLGGRCNVEAVGAVEEAGDDLWTQGLLVAAGDAAVLGEETLELALGAGPVGRAEGVDEGLARARTTAESASVGVELGGAGEGVDARGAAVEGDVDEDGAKRGGAVDVARRVVDAPEGGGCAARSEYLVEMVLRELLRDGLRALGQAAHAVGERRLDAGGDVGLDLCGGLEVARMIRVAAIEDAQAREVFVLGEHLVDARRDLQGDVDMVVEDGVAEEQQPPEALGAQQTVEELLLGGVAGEEERAAPGLQDDVPRTRIPDFTTVSAGGLLAPSACDGASCTPRTRRPARHPCWLKIPSAIHSLQLRNPGLVPPVHAKAASATWRDYVRRHVLKVRA